MEPRLDTEAVLRGAMEGEPAAGGRGQKAEPEPKEARILSEIASQEEQDLPAIKQRLDQGANPNDAAAFDQYGLIPLHVYVAAGRGHMEVVDALADAGAELGWKGQMDGFTALHAAATNDHAVAVRSLAARGGRAAVDCSLRANGHRTPLHLAALNASTAAAKELLEAGVDASLRADGGDTAVDDAVSLGKHDVAELLRAGHAPNLGITHSEVLGAIWLLARAVASKSCSVVCIALGCLLATAGVIARRERFDKAE